MQLRYDDEFIEAAVTLAAGGRLTKVPALQVTRFHRERERLYTILDPDERNAAFFRLHLEWFREWGLERPINDVFAAFRLVREALTTLGIRRSIDKRDEGAELYVNESGERTGMLALRLERLGRPEALKEYLRHEFMHLHDMLDPGFGYSPSIDVPGLNSAQQRLALERYRLLWDITIDGRLAAAGHAPMLSRAQHVEAFARGYSFWPEPRRAETFASLWQEPAPRHAGLIALIADPRGWRTVTGPSPGAACPLCGFPTFAWAESSAVPEKVQAAVIAEFPTWQPAHGLCQRCFEAYTVRIDWVRTGAGRSP